MTEPTGTLIINEINAEDFDCSSRDYVYLDLESYRYVTVTLDGGNIIGIRKESIENADWRLLVPIANKGYRCGKYHLRFLGLSETLHNVVLFEVSQDKDN